MRPKVGQHVIYQTDERGGKRYVLPAVINCTEDSHPGAAEDNPVPVPSGTTVHLTIFTPGGAGSYTELNVPFDTAGKPRSWRFNEEADEAEFETGTPGPQEHKDAFEQHDELYQANKTEDES